MRNLFLRMFVIIGLVFLVVSAGFSQEILKTRKTAMVIKSIDNFPDISKDNQVCVLEEGTHVEVLDWEDYYNIKDFFAKVEILEGECRGKTGWIVKDNLAR